jgi:hypothetical protein
MASQYLPYIHIHIRLYARGSSGLFYRGPEDTSIAIDARNRIQVLNTMLDLGTAEKEQRAAFIVRIRLSLAPIPFDLSKSSLPPTTHLISDPAPLCFSVIMPHAHMKLNHLIFFT